MLFRANRALDAEKKKLADDNFKYFYSFLTGLALISSLAAPGFWVP